jgi:DNA-binding response OmpR family regulator
VEKTNNTETVSQSRVYSRECYDLLLVDINMPHMNGFELSERILAIDINVKVCFVSCAEEINYEALREMSPALSLGCIIRKPVSIDYLVKRIRAELD